jgi:outer membrane protein OmpA-like peptidoglycan-associated protein
MKHIFFVFLLIVFTGNAHAQLLKKLGDRAKNKMEQKAGDKVDKTIDNATDGKSETENGEVKVKTDEDGTKVKTETKNTEGLKAYSKYDFVPGEKVMAYEDYTAAAIGDFPARWNTNATAEIVTLNNKEGKWMKIGKEGAFHPEFITNIPENFTMEFDLGVNNEWAGTHFAVNIAKLEKPQDFTDYYHYVSWRGNYAVHLELKPGQHGRTGANSRIQAGSSGNYTVNNDVDFKVWDNASNNFAHVSMWRQGQRLRVYVNGEKIWDLPRAFDATSKFNAVTFAMQGSYKPDDYFLLGNIRLAVGAPDTRNKLITEGKFVTNGILFDVNSDKIKPESYGTLKEIAGVLNENADVKVKIIGHTDGDGDDAKNLDLSKRRAASVRMVLTSEFGIDGSRFETDGMGETKPVGDNKTPEGKAQNRRVEFIKL